MGNFSTRVDSSKPDPGKPTAKSISTQIVESQIISWNNKSISVFCKASSSCNEYGDKLNASEMLPNLCVHSANKSTMCSLSNGSSSIMTSTCVDVKTPITATSIKVESVKQKKMCSCKLGAAWSEFRKRIKSPGNSRPTSVCTARFRPESLETPFQMVDSIEKAGTNASFLPPSNRFSLPVYIHSGNEATETTSLMNENTKLNGIPQLSYSIRDRNHPYIRPSPGIGFQWDTTSTINSSILSDACRDSLASLTSIPTESLMKESNGVKMTSAYNKSPGRPLFFRRKQRTMRSISENLTRGVGDIQSSEISSTPFILSELLPSNNLPTCEHLPRQLTTIDPPGSPMGNYKRLRSLPGRSSLPKSRAQSIKLKESSNKTPTTPHSLAQSRAKTISCNPPRMIQVTLNAACDSETDFPFNCTHLCSTQQSGILLSTDQHRLCQQSLKNVKISLLKLRTVLTENTGHMHTFHEQLENRNPALSNISPISNSPITPSSPLYGFGVSSLSSQFNQLHFNSSIPSSPTLLEDALAEIGKLKAEIEFLRLELVKKDAALLLLQQNPIKTNA